MDLSPLRALVTSLNFSTHGVAATVTRPSQAAIVTTVIWLTAVTEDLPAGFDLQRATARKAIAVPTADVPTLPRGTVIVAAEAVGGAVKTWTVDGIARVEPGQIRAIVIEGP